MPTFKLSKEEQKIFNKAVKAGIKPEPLIEKYGVEFILTLLEDTQENRLSVYLSYPRNITRHDDNLQQQYEQDLLTAGFKFHEFPEDFVDEDTGDVVSINRKNIYCIK